MKYDDYDLILVDYTLDKCEPSQFGNEILKQLRDKRLFADAIFYSSSDIEKLYEKVKEYRIQNVTVMERTTFLTENISQIINIIEYFLKKELDLNSMRGIMMSEVASFDNEIWDTLKKIVESNSIIPYVKCKANIQKKEFDNINNEDLLKRLVSKETSTIFFTSRVKNNVF